MRGREGILSHISPRAAAAALLMLDQILDEYAAEKGTPMAPVDRQVISDLLRAIVRRDCRIEAL